MTINPHKAAWAARQAEALERPAPRASIPHISDRQYAMEQRARSADSVRRVREALRYRRLQAGYLGITLDELLERLERAAAA